MRQGGRYIRDKKGKTRLVERTDHHPKGDRPRDARGDPLNAPPPAPQPTRETDVKETSDAT